MKTAVHMQHLAGRVIELAVGDGADGFGYVRGLAHPPLRQEPSRDAIFVCGCHCGDHVRMMPGSISNTVMLCGASRAANSFTAMLMAALVMQ